MYGNNPIYNPMLNPYLQQNSQPMYQQPRQEVVKVSGENGARAYPMGANSSALLLDESGKLIWAVTTDGAGYKTVMPYDITPHKSTEISDYNTLEQRITRLEGMIMNGNTADITATQHEGGTEQPELSANKRADKRS